MLIARGSRRPELRTVILDMRTPAAKIRMKHDTRCSHYTISDMQIRSIESFEEDFAKLLASPLPVAIAREKLERLWDEVNIAAAQLVLTQHVDPYLTLLKRMQQAFEFRYNPSRPENGIPARRR